MMASNTFQLGPLQHSVVQEMANIGLGHATTALASMTGKAFGMSVPEAQAVPLEELPETLGGGEQLTVGIYMPIEGDTAGHIAFLTPWSSAQCLWTMFIGSAPEDSTEIDELMASTMLEVGNIINGSFLTALSDMTGLSMQATPPQLCVDMCVTVIQAIATYASMVDHAALALRTSIHNDEEHISGYFLFIPTVEGLQSVFTQLGLPEAA
jgi:chemotaxis protein CheC